MRCITKVVRYNSDFLNGVVDSTTEGPDGYKSKPGGLGLLNHITDPTGRHSLSNACRGTGLSPLFYSLINSYMPFQLISITHDAPRHPCNVESQQTA